MSDTPVHWAAVSSAYKKDLDLVAEAALRGDDSPTPSGVVSEAAERLALLISTLAMLDETDEKNVASINAILFYIGYRVAKLSDRLPFTPRSTEIQLPSRHILALIQGSRTLDEVLAEVEEEL